MPVNVKNLIAETFVKLSDEKNIDKITVKDIVEACGISRQAFYYHFQDLLEVIEWSMEQAFEQLLDRSLQEDDPEIVLNDFYHGFGKCRAVYAEAVPFPEAGTGGADDGALRPELFAGADLCERKTAADPV